jgi:Putative zinc ribbon domain
MENSKRNKFCQSCGMPMKKDLLQGGSNLDGSLNLIFCSHCYKNGVFTFNGSLEEMRKHCKEKIIQQGFPKWLAWFFTLGMKRLSRWK